MTFGDRIVAARNELGLNQKELAEKLGITPTRLNYWENNKRQPDIAMIKLLAVTLGKSADYLIGNNVTELRFTIAETEKIRKYRLLDDYGKRTVDAVLDIQADRNRAVRANEIQDMKTIPLIGNAFAAGVGEPDFGLMWSDYEVPANSRAEFAVRITGDSMEPYLHDGSIALGTKRSPEDGDVAALLIDGAFLIKQVCVDSFGNLYLFSLNRDRSDADQMIMAKDDRNVSCFGTIILPRRIPLPDLK